MTDAVGWLAFVPLVFFVLYGIIGGIEFGLPLGGIVTDAQSPQPMRRYFPLIWESANSLLILAAASTMLLFPYLSAALAPLVQILWLVTIGLLVLRALLVFAGHYGALERVDLRWLLAVVSLLIPAVLIQNATVMLTGDGELLNHAGLAITLGVLAAVLPGALWGGYFYRPGRATRQVARLCYWLAVLLANITLPTALLLDGSITETRNVLVLMWPIALATVLGIISLIGVRRRRYFVASTLLIIGLAAAFTAA